MPKYQTLSLIGQGAMGMVYRALDPTLNREVALKVLRTRSDSKAQEVIARFRREITALTTLSHPSVVKIYDVDQVDGQLCYAMELLVAQPLSHIVKENGAFPIELVVSILDQLGDALDHIHEKGLLHRDIKPANIMLEESGRAVLMDFGLVRDRTGKLNPLTGAGVVIGTPRYLAPEILRGREFDGRADVWSLGVVAYEIATGEHPFENANVSQMLAGIMNSDPEPVSERRPDAPAGLSEWIARCLEKDPDERFQTAADAHVALAPIVQKLEYDEAVDKGLSSLAIARSSLAGMRRSGIGRSSLARARRRGKRQFARLAIALAFAFVSVVALCVWVLVTLLNLWRAH